MSNELDVKVKIGFERDGNVSSQNEINQLNKTNEALDKQSKALDKTNKARKTSVSGIIKSTALYATFGTIVYSVIGYVKDLGKEFGELERYLDRTAAITGSNTEAYKNLKASVLSTAASFNIGVEEMGAFTVEMSKLGLTAKEISVVAQEAATLSKILGESMPESGGLIIATLKQFNMEIEESSKVSAVFFDLIKNSPLDIKNLKTAMQYVGAAAEGTGVKFEEAAKMMQLLSERGLKSSKIGTGLRNVFLELSDSSDGVIGGLRRMYEEGVSFSEIVDIFGKRGAIAAQLLISNFSELEIMFAEKTPNSIDGMIASFRATEGTFDWFGRKWNYLKAIISDFWENPATMWLFGTGQAVQETQATESIRGLVEMADELKVRKSIFQEISDRVDDIAKSGRELEKADFYNFQTQFLQADTSKSIERDDIVDGIENFVKKEYERLKSSSQLEKVREDANALIRDTLGGKTVQEFIESDFETGAEYNSKINSINEDIDAMSNEIKTLNKQRQEAENLWNEDEVKRLDSKISKLNTKRKVYMEAWADLSQVNKDVLSEINARGLELKKVAKEIGVNYEATANEIAKADEKFGDFESKWAEILCAKGFTSWCKETKAKKAPTPDLSYWQDQIDGIYAAEMELDLSQFGVDNVMFDKVKEGEISFDFLQEFINMQSDGAVDAINNAYDLQEQKITDAYTEKFGLYFDMETYIDEAIKKYGAEGYDVSSLEKLKSKIQSMQNKAQVQLDKSLEKNDSDRDGAIGKVNSKRENWVTKLFSIDKDEAEESLDNMKEFLAQWGNVIRSAMQEIGQIFKDSNDAFMEDLKARTDAEIETIEKRSEAEEDINKAMLDSEVITAEAYAKARERIHRKEIDEKNAINKQYFEAKKKTDTENAIVDGIAAVANAFITTFQSVGGGWWGAAAGAAMAAVMGVQTSKRINAIKKRKFYPVKYADGGFVEGASHEQGGVPFTVQGQGGYEMEGGEFIVNKRAASQYADLLEAINGGNARLGENFFADGGSVARNENVPNSGSTNTMGDIQVKAYITKRDIGNYLRSESINNDIRRL